MKISELLSDFSIYKSIEEERVLSKLQTPVLLSSLSPREQQITENMIRKSLVIRIGDRNPRVVANSD